MIEDDFDTSYIDKRNFLLMMSPGDGQKISALSGFSPASEDVVEAETLDVITNWISLAAGGTLKYVRNASEWVSEFVADAFDVDEDQLTGVVQAYYAYSVALLIYLMKSEVIEVYALGDTTTNIQDFIDFLPSTFTAVTFEPHDEDLGEDDE